MHFKIVVLFSVLNFFTATWSFGLGLRHINGLIDISENFCINNRMIETYFVSEGITNSDQITTLKRNLDEDTTLSEFLISLAYCNKGTFSFAEKSLSTYEVKLFVRMFVAQDKKGKHDGFLNRYELQKLIGKGFNLKKNIKKLIKSEFKDKKRIHVLTYLAVILKHKPLGSGLDEEQIDECHILCDSYDQFLDSEYQQHLFGSLKHIVSKKYVNDLLDIHHVHPAPLELKELVIFWAEYNEAGVKVPFLTTEEVRNAMAQFTKFDQDKDGLLNFEEFSNLVVEEYSDPDAKALIKTFNPLKSRLMCAVMFLKVKLLNDVPRKTLAMLWDDDK
ncbi:uncharacterized protein LOC126846717 [Adelges cooleyi]|uniref:uncharacterized protein LOC126846717 n=1 Tax=Adelges cooleyi TaxID=133065 RepID=UPI0021801B60|nr:uncharacterized protein LOC126846717 [Adelges cooleyi]